MTILCDDVIDTVAASSSLIHSITGAVILSSAQIVTSIVGGGIISPSVITESVTAAAYVTDWKAGEVDEQVSASSTVVTQIVNPATAIIVSSASVVDIVTNYIYQPRITETLSASDTLFYEESSPRIITETVYASSAVLQSQNYSTLVTNSADVSDTVFPFFLKTIDDTVAASSAVYQSAVYMPQLVTNTMAASSYVLDDGLVLQNMVVDTASASSVILDELTAFNLIIDHAAFDDAISHDALTATTWSSDTQSFGMSKLNGLGVTNLVTAAGDWYGLSNGNIVKLIEQRKTVRESNIPRLDEATISASLVQAGMTGNFLVYLAENSGASDWQYSEVVVSASNVGQLVQCGLCVRGNIATSNKFSTYALLMRSNGSISLAHYDISAGVATGSSLGVVMTSATGSYAVGDTVALSVSGYGNQTYLTAMVNGVQLIQHNFSAASSDFMATGLQGTIYLDQAATVVTGFEAGIMSAPAELETGLSDFSDDKLKRCSYFRCAFQGADPLTVTIGNTGDGLENSYSYPMNERLADEITPNRVSLGKGARSRHWRVGITSTGKQFVLRDASLEVEPITRKI